MNTTKLTGTLHVGVEDYLTEARKQGQEEEERVTLVQGESGDDKNSDRITLSREAVQLSQSMQAAKGDDKSASETAKEQQVKTLKKQIEKLKEQIKEKQQSDLPEDQKQQQISQLQEQLIQYQNQLAKLQKGDGAGGNIPAVGTDAKGSANSLT
ncbi:MAG: hypothetical protein AB7E32_10095 [Desulfovibrio sp.]